MLHKAFPSDGRNRLCCQFSGPNQTFEALKIAERAVNEAIKEGAQEVKLTYSNIVDEIENPDGLIARVFVTGFKADPSFKEDGNPTIEDTGCCDPRST